MFAMSLSCCLPRFLSYCWHSSTFRGRTEKVMACNVPYCIAFQLLLFSVICSEFTRAFQHATDRIQARASFDHFDGSGTCACRILTTSRSQLVSVQNCFRSSFIYCPAVIEMNMEDRGRFFDALTALSAF